MAILLCGVLEHLSDPEATAAAAAWREALPLGSALVICHVSASPVAGDPDLMAGLEQAAHIHGEHAGPYTLRSRAELEELFAGFTLLRPGLTEADRWRAAAVPSDSRQRAAFGHGGGHSTVPVLAGVGALGEPDLLGVPDVLGVHAWDQQRHPSRRTPGGAPWS